MKRFTSHAVSILINIIFVLITYNWFCQLSWPIMVLVNLVIQLPIFFIQYYNMSTFQPIQIYED